MIVDPTGRTAGQAATLLHALDATSPLGPVAGWPQSLRTIVDLIINCGQPMFVVWGPELGLVYNDAYAQILGAKHPGAFGRPFLEVWAEIRADLLPLVARTLGGERIWHENLHLVMARHGYPEDTWFDFSYSPLTDESGAVAGIFCACNETTRRVQAEAALREGEARFRTAADSSPALMWMTDERSEVVFANQRYRTFFGVETDAMLGEGWRSIVHPEDVDAFNQSFLAAAEARERFQGRVRVLHPELGVRWLDCNGAPRVGAEGEFLGYVGVNIDVTEAVVAEERLRGSEQALKAERDRLYSLFEDAPGLVAVLHGPEHVFQLANRAYRDLVGARELIGRTAREVLPELEGQGLFELLDQVYATGEPFVGHGVPTRIKRSGASEPEERYFDFVYQPIREADGAISGIFAQGSDVTDRTLAESRQKLLLDELNHRVKNNLATVQSIAYQTARHAPDLDTFRATFDARLIALSRTHDVLTASAWESADLHALLRAELGIYGEDRVRLEGPRVLLTPQQGLALGLVIHELATNAAKYGALNNDDGGCVRVTWSRRKAAAGRELEIIWHERDGPAVTPPASRGFGSRLIERGVQEIGGEVAREWRADGLHCRITVPL